MKHSILLLTALRYHRKHWLQLILSIVGIALGVAVFVGVDVANTSANAAFESSAAFVRGATTHRLLPLNGALDEQLFVSQFASQGITAAPIIELPVRITSSNAPATLLGVDAIEEASFRDATRLGLLGGSASDTLITVPATALVSHTLVASPTTEALSINTGRSVYSLQIIGTLPADAGTANMIVTDIATAQELAGMVGELTRIDLILSNEHAMQLQSNLPTGTVLVRAGSENQAFDQLSNAFRINILALGLLALAVGMFLVYSSASFSLQRRAHSFAILRTLGLGRRDLAVGTFKEFLLLGFVASTIGVLLGHALAGMLVELMLFTVGDFSFRNAVAVSNVNFWLYAKGLSIGIAATVLAVAGPVRIAVQRDSNAALQRSASELRARRLSASGLWVAAVLLVIGITLLNLPSLSLLLAFGGLFAVLAAAACATPAAVAAIVSMLQRVFKSAGSFVFLHAARNVIAHQSRVAVATAALTLAVSCVIGVGVMIDSFRSSLGTWLDSTLTSDIYVSLTGELDANDSLIQWLRSDSRVAGVSQTRVADTQGPWGEAAIRAFQPGERGWGIAISEGDVESALLRLDTQDAVAITEPFALRSGLTVGDQLRLPHANGQDEVEIVAVYRDYNAGGASILMSLARFQRVWGDTQIDGIGVEVRNGDQIGELEAQIGQRFPRGVARITTTTGIKQISLEIFDRTFLITEVLRVLAGGIAFLGMLSALMAVQLARKREFGILRSLGFTPREMRRLIMTETTILGFCAGIFAVPIGVTLAALLVFVINVRSFGWTMEFEVEPAALLPGFALAIGAAVLAGIAPAVNSYKTSVAATLRHA